MRIVEEDFIMESCGGLFDLTFLKKVKNEDGKMVIKKLKPAYGCSLASCVKRIVRFRFKNKFESESPYLLEALKEIIKLEKEIVNLCREPEKEDFDTGE